MQIRQLLAALSDDRTALLGSHRGALADELDRLRASAAAVDAVLGADVDPRCLFGTTV